MELSATFDLAEMVKSQTAARLGIDNTPDDAIVAALPAVAVNILEPVRRQFERPVVVTSGYRCPTLNAAIGGSASSQHMKGQAADFEVPGHGNLEVAEWIRDNLEFDQLILEYYTPGDPNSGWVHCSYVAPGQCRKDVRSCKAGPVYLPGLVLT
jgi:zinc D-Ala-D-Ala carboxypeptidase